MSAAALRAIAGLGYCAPATASTALPRPWLPLDPEPAQCRVGEGKAALANEVLNFVLRAAGNSLQLAQLENRFVHESETLQGRLFALQTRDGTSIGAAEFQLLGQLRCVPISGSANAARAAERLPGIALAGEFEEAATGIHVAWRATLRDRTNYVRKDFEIAADRGADLASITLIDLHLQQPWVAGTADGSPLVAGDNFYGIEHPMAHAQILQGRATATLKRVLPLRAGVSERYSAVLGVRRMNVRCGHGRRSISRYDPAKCWSGIWSLRPADRLHRITLICTGRGSRLQLACRRPPPSDADRPNSAPQWITSFNTADVLPESLAPPS